MKMLFMFAWTKQARLFYEFLLDIGYTQNTVDYLSFCGVGVDTTSKTIHLRREYEEGPCHSEYYNQIVDLRDWTDQNRVICTYFDCGSPQNARQFENFVVRAGFKPLYNGMISPNDEKCGIIATYTKQSCGELVYGFLRVVSESCINIAPLFGDKPMNEKPLFVVYTRLDPLREALWSIATGNGWKPVHGDAESQYLCFYTKHEMKLQAYANLPPGVPQYDIIINWDTVLSLIQFQDKPIKIGDYTVQFCDGYVRIDDWQIDNESLKKISQQVLDDECPY